MNVLTSHLPVVQGRKHDLDDYITRQCELTERHAADLNATWQRIVETAVATGHTLNDAIQMADRWLISGELPL